MERLAVAAAGGVDTAATYGVGDSGGVLGVLLGSECPLPLALAGARSWGAAHWPSASRASASYPARKMGSPVAAARLR
jgi:hypothetical protein